MSEYLETVFPGLRSTAFRVTSPAETKYNCVVWAANDTSQWRWPVEGAPWPTSAARELSRHAFVPAFQTLGFNAGTDEALELGVEKIALFADAAGVPTHAARQLPTGRWTSKLGQAEDIEHDLHALEGEIYGTVASILKRTV